MRTNTAIVGACLIFMAGIWIATPRPELKNDAKDNLPVKAAEPTVTPTQEPSFDNLVEEGKIIIAQKDADRVGDTAGGSLEHRRQISETQRNLSPPLAAYEQYQTPITRQLAQAKAITNCGFRDGNWYRSILSGATINAASDPMAIRTREALSPLELETGVAYLQNVANDSYDMIADPNDLKASCERVAGAPFISSLDALQIRLSSRF